MSELITEVGKHRKNIKYETLTFSISELVGMYTAEPKEIDIHPDFQRLFRWSRDQQSSFIESLILEIPVPPLFFYERADDGKWDLLDGLQRLSTLIRFVGPETTVPQDAIGEQGNESEWHYTNQNDVTTPLQLVGGEYLKSLEGHSFNTLPIQLQLNLKRARLHIYILKRETDEIYKYEVFKRLNRGGVDLEEQELRNCSVRLLDSKFPTLLQEMAKNGDFVETISLSGTKSLSGYSEELALRYLAMKNNAAAFSHDVANFLTHYMEQVARGKLPFEYDKERTTFEGICKLLKSIADSGQLFRARRDDGTAVGPFSPTLFEMIMVSMGSNLAAAEKMTQAKLKDKLMSLVDKAKTDNLTGGGSNSKVKTLGRMNLAKDWLIKA